VRVLELSDREDAAAFAAKLFRRWGAEVIKVESPERAASRPAADLAVNGGKRRVRLDVRDRGDRAAIEALARTADVVLTDHDVADLDAHGILAIGEGSTAVRVSITPFGLDGPYRDMPATNATLLALGGYTWLMGDPGRAPLTMPGNYVPYQAGTFAYLAALATLLGGSPARTIEVSMLECLASLHQFTDTMWRFEGIVRSRHGNRWENLCPTTLLPAADGWYGVNILQAFWFPFAHWIGRPETALEGPWATNAGRMADQDAVEAAAMKALWDVPRREIFRAGQENWRVPVGFAASLREVLDDPHLAERGFWRTMPAAGGELRVPGAPYRFAGEEPPEEPPLREPEPAGGIAWDAFPAPRLAAGAEDAARPLAGVRVLDLTRIWSGPLATRILGDLGAEVIKIEASTGRGAVFPADAGPRPWNTQGLFNKLSRNKTSLCIDLKAPEGRSIFLDLVKQADVVIENFSARAMPGLGLGYEQLKAANDRIIYLAMPAFGMRGPYRDYVGLGPSIEPITGMTALMGYSDDEPRVTSKALTDAIAGTTAASAVIQALWYRAGTGEGALIDLSQHETGVGYLAEAFIERQLTGEEPQRTGNAHASMAPHGVYRCAGDDEWIALAARNDREWAALCGVLGLAAVPGYASAGGRLAARAELDASVQAATSGRDKYELMAALAAAGVPAGAVQRPPEYLDDRHLRDRGYFAELAHPEAGSTPWDGNPLRFDGDRGHDSWFAAPCLGADNRGTLSALLGFDAEHLDRLYAEGVLAEAPPAPPSGG